MARHLGDKWGYIRPRELEKLARYRCSTLSGSGPRFDVSINERAGSYGGVGSGGVSSDSGPELVLDWSVIGRGTLASFVPKMLGLVSVAPKCEPVAFKMGDQVWISVERRRRLLGRLQRCCVLAHKLDLPDHRLAAITVSTTTIPVRRKRR